MIRVGITTYNRNEMVERLVNAIAGEGVDIYVYDDCSPVPVELENATVYRYEENAGIDFWYTRVRDMLTDARDDKGWKYMLWMPDDVVPLRDDLIEHLTAEFKRLKRLDSNTVCLNPFKLRNHPCVQWVNYEPRKRYGVYQTQWMDCCGFVDRRFVNVAERTMQRHLPHYLYSDENTGTGVGRAISIMLHTLGYHLYQVPETLLSHGHHPSALSPHQSTEHKVTP